MSKNLRVALIPRFPNNPYIPQLESQLSALGVVVVRLGTSAWSLIAGFLVTRPHVLHLQWLHPFHMGRYGITALLRALMLVTGWIVLRLLGRRFVWTVHNLKDHDDRHPRVARMLTGYVARRADAVIVHCEHAKRALHARFPRTRESRIYVIPHGNYSDAYENTVSCAESRRRLGLADDNFVILSFGQIRRYKGIEVLIETFRSLPDANLRLVIAGRIPDSHAERALRSRVSGDSRILFRPGFVADDEVQWYLNACDVVACPFEDVLTSGSVLLGMTFARPCIVPRLGCIPEQIDDLGAFFYEPDDPNGFSQALHRAIASGPRLPAMGRRNQLRANEWNWRRVAEMTLTVYRKIFGAAESESS